MGFVLTMADKITCSFTGAVQTASTVKLQVNQQPVLVGNSLVGKAVGICAGASSQQPVCASVLSVSAGESQKLQAGGAAVILDTLDGKTTPEHAPNKLLLLPGTQSKLQAS